MVQLDVVSVLLVVVSIAIASYFIRRALLLRARTHAAGLPTSTTPLIGLVGLIVGIVAGLIFIVLTLLS